MSACVSLQKSEDLVWASSKSFIVVTPRVDLVVSIVSDDLRTFASWSETNNLLNKLSKVQKLGLKSFEISKLEPILK